jgi:hypothetical protein
MGAVVKFNINKLLYPEGITVLPDVVGSKNLQKLLCR